MIPTIKDITATVFLGCVRAVSLLPFPLLYAFSSLICRLLMVSGGYRRHMVESNLVRCFPDASPEQISTWRREYYQFLIDSLFETIKSLSMRGEALDSRMRLLNESQAAEWITEGGGIIFASHYGNFEWTSQRVDRFIQKQGMKTAAVYARLSPFFLEHTMIRLRGKWGAKMVKRHQALRDSIRLIRQGYKIGFIIDQSPAVSAPAIHHPFLGVDTRWIAGSTKLAIKSGSPVLFAQVHRLGRGSYSLEFIRLDRPGVTEMPEAALLSNYISHLEESIRRAPAYWLWSHNRWKGMGQLQSNGTKQNN